MEFIMLRAKHCESGGKQQRNCFIAKSDAHIHYIWIRHLHRHMRWTVLAQNNDLVRNMGSALVSSKRNNLLRTLTWFRSCFFVRILLSCYQDSYDYNKCILMRSNWNLDTILRSSTWNNEYFLLFSTKHAPDANNNNAKTTKIQKQSVSKYKCISLTSRGTEDAHFSINKLEFAGLSLAKEHFNCE